MSKVRSKR